MASDSSQSSPATSNPLRGLLGSLNRRRNNRSESGPENQTGLSSPNPDTTEDSPCNSPEDQSPSSPSSAKPLTSTHLILSSVQSESGPENQTGLSSPNPDTTEDSPCNSPEDQSPSSPSSAKPLTSTHLILSSVQSESGPENQTGLSSPNPGEHLSSQTSGYL
ncbi:uncharacterized protein TRUGW13939_10970 [Talaromyces rugulosus]|uniref:Uncharacterized protein n=1 Tax=Talaromyces rugulosus TaxID=121627 RepID=A0A7H8RBF8_TALRU|nr:uncharacterized protein TRUGW13939_10970 [Talaromyces rugulosus]QKX63799.1 hypothetical protein TRUGW13939_10970 [Talaromyces rugulosus]